MISAKNIVSIPPSWFSRAEALWSGRWGKAISMHEHSRDKLLRELAVTRLKIQHLKNRLKETA